MNKTFIFKVNINGFKVNTLEVENHIRQHLPGIKRSCVSGLEFDKERHLVCFYENHTNQHVSPGKVLIYTALNVI